MEPESEPTPSPIAPAKARRARGSKFRERVAISASLAAVAILLISVVPTLVLPWSPIAHWSCLTERSSEKEPAWVPAILMNAPFGGNVTGNASIPSGYIDNGLGFGTSDGTSAGNGSYAGVFFHLWLFLAPEKTELALGPGADRRCMSAWTVSSVATDFSGSQVYSGILGGKGSMSDIGEPTSVSLSPPVNNTSVVFDNGFTAANVQPISTCNGPSQRLDSRVPSLSVTVSTSIDSAINQISFRIPFDQEFRYYFPANYGSWQIDNLSAPGGPGGGWAFSYSPCPP
jgi:hypothetical protein